VFTVGDAFSPTFLQVAAGDTVRWTFSGGSDGMGHNVRFATTAGHPADISIFKTGTQSRVFTTRGVFHYDCDVHPGMFGEVTVQ
jgi:plastocyanin